jgi:hypothetical protein
MKWNELDEVMHDNDLDASDDDVMVYEFGTGDFHDTDVIEFEFSHDNEDGPSIYISIKGDDDE